MQDSTAAPDPVSRLRKRLHSAYDELGRLLPTFLARDAVFPGYVTERSVRCGKPSCHCADGARHPTWTVIFKEGGKTRSRALYLADRERAKKLADAYRRVRAAHRQWRKLVREIDGIIDSITDSRAVPYAPRKEQE